MNAVMKRVIFRSILLRYIISYAIIMALLFLGVGIYVSNQFSATIRANIAEENINRLSALRMQHEEKLASLFSIGNQMSLSPYISPFKLKETPMKAYHLKQQLASYTAANDFYDQMYLIFHEDNYLYSSGTSVSLEMFTEKLMNYEHVPAATLNDLLRQQDGEVSVLPGQYIKSSLISETNKQAVTFILPLRLDGRFSIGNALFLIPDSSYQRMFAEEITQMRNLYFFYGQDLIAASRRLSVSDEAVQAALAESEGLPVRDFTVDGVKYLLFIQKGSLLDMRYVSLIPQETVQVKTTRSHVALGLFLLMLSIPCTLLTVYFARRHVKPIRELQKSMGEVTPSPDGFTAIKSGIESLMGQNRALHSRLDEGMAAFRADFVKNFIKCRYTGRDEAVKAAAHLGLAIDRNYYCIALMAAVSRDRHTFDTLYALIEGKGEVAGYGMEIVDQEQYLFALFADSEEALAAWAENVRSLLASLDEEAVIAVSKSHSDFKNAAAAYLEAGTAYDNRFIMGSEHVLRFSDVSAAATDVEPFSRGYLDGFRKALHAGDARSLNDRINELFQILQDKKFSLFAFRVIYNDIIGMLLNKYLSYEDTSSESLRYYDVFELSRCRRVTDLLEILRSLCADILAKEEQNAPREQSISRKVMDYIREHFTEPELSMGVVAESCGISAARLSLEFKEQIGVHPSDYLLLMRLEKAKELLAGTEMPVQDVSVSVGYYDVSGFIRRFKRHTAATPAQYRQSVRSRGEETVQGL